MQTIQTEIAVVGSGFGAAAPAMRLSEAGFGVLILEKGPDILPERDFRQTQDPGYLLRYLKGCSSDTISFTYAEGLGGGSGFYEMVSLRAPSRSFEQRDANGRRLWPEGVDRRSLDPYYDIAEKMLGVEQIGLDEIPKSGVAFAALMKNLGYSCDRARYAVSGCVGSGFCVSGCLFGAKQSLHQNYLPRAGAAGARIMTGIEALRIIPVEHRLEYSRTATSIDELPYRYRIVCRDTRDRFEVAIEAKVIILGGGTIGTAALLLRSRRGLPLLGGHVGRNIAFNGSVKAAGVLPEGFIEGDMLSGRSHPGMISYEFFDTLGITISSVKPLPIMMVAAVHLHAGSGGEYWGKEHVGLMKLYRRRMIVLYALGLTPPAARLRSAGGDSFTPELDIDEELRTYHGRTKGLLGSILTRNGCRLLDARPIDERGAEHEGIHFDTTHMIGSCRMADRRESGVVDAGGEAFAYPGLYVSDGAAVPASLAVNSSLTILANAERIADRILARLQPRRKPLPELRVTTETQRNR